MAAVTFNNGTHVEFPQEIKKPQIHILLMKAATQAAINILFSTEQKEINVTISKKNEDGSFKLVKAVKVLEKQLLVLKHMFPESKGFSIQKIR